MRSAILDTTIYFGHWERGLYEEVLAAVRKAYVIRHSAVVLSELRRGARTRDAQRLVDALYWLARIRWEAIAEPATGTALADLWRGIDVSDPVLPM